MTDHAEHLMEAASAAARRVEAALSKLNAVLDKTPRTAQKDSGVAFGNHHGWWNERRHEDKYRRS